ncbi:MAG: hypothetical protein ACTSSM_14975 [Promethearchaeota archaeon]
MRKKNLILNLGAESGTEVTLTIDIGPYVDLHHRSTKREWRGDVTDDLINRLVFPLYPGNIQFISTIIDGGKGSGKTQKAKRIAERVVDEITELGYSYNIIPVRSISQVTSFFDDSDYQICIIDDGSRYDSRLQQAILEDFNEIRHIYAIQKSNKTGVLIIIWTLQDSFQVGKLLRKDLTAYIFTDCPLDEYSQNFVDRLACGRGIDLLSAWAQKIKDEHKIEFKSRCIVSTESWAGYAKFELPQTEYFRNLEFIEPEETNAISMNYLDGDYLFKEKERINILDELIAALQNYDAILKERKIKTKKLKSKHVEAYIQYLQGWTYDNIAESHGVKTQALSNSYADGGWFSIVREEAIGHIVEWVLVQDNAYYSQYKIIAGNERVDLLSPDEQKAIEVKCRHRYEKPSAKMICTEMHKILSTNSKECELALCIVRKKTAQCRIYTITKNNKNDKSSPTDSNAEVARGPLRPLSPPERKSTFTFQSPSRTSPKDNSRQGRAKAKKARKGGL